MSTLDIPGRATPDKTLWNFFQRIRRLEAVPIRGHYQIKVFADANAGSGNLDTAVRTVVAGDGKFILAIPDDLQLAKLTDCFAYVTTAGSAEITVNLRNVAPGDDPYVFGDEMLIQPMLIQTGDYTSYAAGAANQPVIDPAFAQVFTGSMVSIDVDDAGGGTAEGLGVGLEFAPPPPG